MDVTQNLFNTYKALKADDGKIDAKEEKIIRKMAGNEGVDVKKLEALVKNDDGKVSIDDKNLLHMVKIAQAPINPLDQKVDFGEKMKQKGESGGGAKTGVVPKGEGGAGTVAKAVEKGIAAGIAAAAKATYKNPADKTPESANIRKLMGVMLDANSGEKTKIIANLVNEYNKPGANKADIINKLQAFLKDKCGVELDCQELNGMATKLGKKVGDKTLMEKIMDIPKPKTPEENKKLQENIKRSPVDLTDFFTATSAKDIEKTTEDVVAGRDGC